jgi:hypothetical protein
MTFRTKLELKHICNRCVEEEFLSNEIFKKGSRARCSYCERVGKTITLECFSDSIDCAFQKHYARVHEDPDLHGLFSRFGPAILAEPVVDAIGNAAGIDRSPASDVQQILERRYQSKSAYEIGEATEYSIESRYMERNVTDEKWRQEWATFEHELKHSARFFNRTGAALLASVFEDIEQLPVRENRQLVTNAGPGTQMSRFYRARVFQSDHLLEDAIKAPEKHIGPPPPKLATAGRMNARGISVFYGADSARGAIAEVRPPVGAKTVVAAFDIVRPLTLLDLTALTYVDLVDGSIFDAATQLRIERVIFLRSLGDRMTRPVMPDDHEIEYLVTQAIADFLATENSRRYDGIIFNSVQTYDCKNVVLFRHAASVEPIDRPDKSLFSVQTSEWVDDDVKTAYSVLEMAEPNAPMREQVTPRPGSSGDEPEATLRLNQESVFVHHILKVEYTDQVYRVQHRLVERFSEF